MSYFPLLHCCKILGHHRGCSQLLTNLRPNDQKLFYNLLLKHRETQLENYVPEIGHSTSDYHHARPLTQVKKLSTRQFSQPNRSGHGRAVSRFTVVSNASKTGHVKRNSGYAETEAAQTVQSYDPFKASRPQNLVATGEAAQANIVIYRGRPTSQQTRPRSRVSHNSSNAFVTRSRERSLAPPPVFASRSSLASSTRSRRSAQGTGGCGP